MTDIRDLHARWMRDPTYRQDYEALEGEFALASALIRARADAGLTQEELAERMGTKQEVIARWEGGKVMPSTRTLARLAKATGTRLQISFAPSRSAAE
jgi:transcriptional regulator with XRE-family HTH domain